MFRLMASVEPSGLRVASAGGLVAGYIFTVRSLRGLGTAILRSGTARAVGWKALTGEYAIRPAVLARLVADKLAMTLAPCCRGFRGGQVLSLAVRTRARGAGIGRRLMEAGLEHLEDEQVQQVKLEVRPANIPALKLYRSFGFREVGRVRDSLGPWIVMVNQLGGAAGSH